MVQLKTGTSYKYGIGENTINVVFKTPRNNVQITNSLCGGDPVYGHTKYIYDKNWVVLCSEYDYVDILKTEIKLFNDVPNRLTKLNHTNGNIDMYIITSKNGTNKSNILIENLKQFDFINLIKFEKYEGFSEYKSHLELINYAKKNNIKYIIIIGENYDIDYNIDYDFRKNILNTLTEKYDCYNIFTNESSDNYFKSKIDNFNISKLETLGSFIMYSQNVYDDILILDDVISYVQYLTSTFLFLTYNIPL